MKTFKQFLLAEEIHNNELKELLENLCGPFIRESKSSGLLRRGIKGLNNESAENIADPLDDGYLDGDPQKMIPYWTKTVRQDRKPVDLTPKLHAEVDNWFNEKFGFKARSQTMFCFGEHAGEDTVKQYGTVYFVFPIGEFKYVWSPHVQDLFNAKSRYMAMYPEDVTDAEKEKYTPLEFFMEGLDYTDKDFGKAVVARHEIMIKCDKYLAFPLSAEEALRQALDITY